jgi:acyl-CoA thioester hydrolase
MMPVEMQGTAVYEGHVLPEWIDVNKHMNVAYYILAFDRAVDALWDRFGITDEYISATRGSTFAVECHVTYQNELHENDPFVVTAQILGYDEKRIHQFQRIYHAEKGFLAATAEWMNLHVSLETRRVSPWPEVILQRLGELTAAQRGQTRPAEEGRQMSIRHPLYAL